MVFSILIAHGDLIFEFSKFLTILLAMETCGKYSVTNGDLQNRLSITSSTSILCIIRSAQQSCENVADAF